MNSPNATFNDFEFSPTRFKGKSSAKIIDFPLLPQFPKPVPAAVNGAALADARALPEGQDRKWQDVAIIAALSALIHFTLYQNFDRSDFDAELIEPEKPVNKVEISIVRPQPKPVAPPPPPKAKPKPVQKKAVPLKKPKEKPKPKPEEPVYEAPLAEPVLEAPPAPPAPAPVEKVTPPRGGAGYLKNPPPVYPEIAMDRGWQGKVLLKVLVKANGKPKTVSVLKSSGKTVLDKEALRTVKKWTFMPARRGATPIDGWVTVPITFSLR